MTTRSVDTVESTVERLALAIQAQVLSGAVPVGTRLRQEALAEEFGVSRTPVREALRQLQATGLLELLPNRGAHVPTRDEEAVGSAIAISSAYAKPSRCSGSRSRH